MKISEMDGVPVVWLGTTLGDAQPEELEEYFKGEGYTVKFVEEFKDKEGCANIIFTLHDNISKFCMYRLMIPDLKWFDDYIVNYHDRLPESLMKKYEIPATKEEAEYA